MEEGMGGLIGFAIIATVVVFVIGTILTIGVFLGGAALLTAFVWGCVVGTRNFFQVLGLAHAEVPEGLPGGEKSKLAVGEEQPAFLLYPLDRGWRVMRYVSSNVFRLTGEAAQFWYGHAKRFGEQAKHGNLAMRWWLGMLALGAGLGGVSQYFSTTIFVGLFVGLQFIVMAIWAGVSGIAILILTGVNKAYAAFYRIHARCPSCHEGMDIPVYTCPSCATDHTRLWPGKYGVLHHKCSGCGSTKLSTFQWYRRSLDGKCPHCSSPLNPAIGTKTDIHIPVIGGPSTGKSNFIVMATRALIEDCHMSGRAQIDFPDPKDEQAFQANLDLLADGHELQKTTALIPQAYTLSVARPHRPVGKVLYFYDAAGEAYASEDQTQQQKYFEYVDGLIFVVDPFAISGLASEFEESINSVRTSLRPSSLGVMEAYERMLSMLEASVGLKRGRRFSHPIAVTIAKADALGLEDKIGSAAARRLMASDPKIKAEADAIDRLCREFLEEYGLDNFVRDVDLQFGKAKYFSCSALGRMPDPADRRPYHAVRADQPLSWILSRLGVVDPAPSAVSVLAPGREAEEAVPA